MKEFGFELRDQKITWFDATKGQEDHIWAQQLEKEKENEDWKELDSSLKKTEDDIEILIMELKSFINTPNHGENHDTNLMEYYKALVSCMDLKLLVMEKRIMESDDGKDLIAYKEQISMCLDVIRLKTQQVDQQLEKFLMLGDDFMEIFDEYCKRQTTIIELDKDLARLQ